VAAAAILSMLLVQAVGGGESPKGTTRPESPESVRSPTDALGKDKLMPVRWSAGCGVDSLYVCLRLVGINADYVQLARRAGIKEGAEWVSLNTLYQIARASGAHALALQVSGGLEDELKQILAGTDRRAAILHLRKTEAAPDHVIPVFLDGKGQVRVAGEYAQGAARDEWKKLWSGHMLLISGKPLVEIGKSPGRGRIEVDSTTVSLGKAEIGASIPVRLTVRNGGDGVLHLTGVRASCNCSKPTLDSERLDAGDSASVKSTIEAGVRTGRFNAQYLILSDDPERPAVSVTVDWEVVSPPFELRPLQIDALVDEGGGATEATLKCIPRDPNVGMDGIKGTASEEWIQVVARPDAGCVGVSLKPTWTEGRRTATVVITKDGWPGKVVIPLSVEVLPAIIVEPAEILVRRDAQGKCGPVEITVKAREKNGKCEVKDVALVGLGGRVGVSRNDSGGWTLTVVIEDREAGASGIAEGRIRAHVSGDREKVIDVPVYVMSSK
jgi:hypothetical protein